MALPAGRGPICDENDPNFNDCGFVHTNSGIPNKAASLIIAGGRFNGFTITALGQQRAERLFYNVIANRLTNNAQFIDARNATIAEARVLYGSSAECTVRNAYSAVGLGTGDIDCDGVEDTVPSTVDSDGDGIADVRDNCPSLSSTDLRDNDRDGVENVCDNCVNAFNPDQRNADGDSYGNACDGDADDDGLMNTEEVALFGTDPFNWDTDGDGISDLTDNCKLNANADQSDNGSDLYGNACDPDDDNDGLTDAEENRLGTDPLRNDTDGDGIGDDSDNCKLTPNLNQSDNGDHDGVGDACDNCPTTWNPDQKNSDRDSIGDACDADDDNDTIPDGDDNCPLLYNPTQVDRDGDGIGDVCDPCPDDAVNSCLIRPRFEDIYGKYIQISGLEECIGTGWSELGACLFLDPRSDQPWCPVALQMRDACCPPNAMCVGPGFSLRLPGGTLISNVRAADLGFHDDDGFGISGSILPDIDGDAIPDVIIGAPFADVDGLVDAGSVVIFSGASGTILNRLNGAAEGDQFGMALSRLGQSGRFLVGAPGRNVFGNSDEGSVYLFERDGTPVMRLDGALHGEALGSLVSEVGDINSDGIPEFLASAPGADPTISQGRAFLFSWVACVSSGWR